MLLWYFALLRACSGSSFATLDSDTVDWRNGNHLGPVRQDHRPNVTWAAVTIDTVASHFSIQCNKTVHLSADWLLHCVPQVDPDVSDGLQFAHVHGVCNITNTSAAGGSCDRCSPAIKSGPPLRVQSDNDLIKQAVQRGPVTVLVDATPPSFRSYKSGIYTDFACTAAPSHPAIIVGYGRAGAGEYWILRNSWGGSWGEGGYMRIAMHVPLLYGMCNIAEFPLTIHEAQC